MGGQEARNTLVAGMQLSPLWNSQRTNMNAELQSKKKTWRSLRSIGWKAPTGSAITAPEGQWVSWLAEILALELAISPSDTKPDDFRFTMSDLKSIISLSLFRKPSMLPLFNVI
jgi:hypothetical protein